MWTYTCTACGARVSHESDAEAQKLFHAHVLTVHPKAHTTVLTKVGGES